MYLFLCGHFEILQELKKLLKSKLNLNPTKIKTPAPKGGWSYVCFKSEEEKATALKILNGYTWKKQTLIAQEAKAVPDPLVKKRNLKSNDSNISSKRVKLDVKDLLEQVNNASTPLWNAPYPNQASIIFWSNLILWFEINCN